MTGAFTGVIALGFAVLSGFCYRIAREWEYQAKRVLGFRETALLLIPGLVFTFAGLAVFGAIRMGFPSHTPDVGALLRGSGEYARSNFPYLLGWTAGVIFIGCALATLGGWIATLAQKKLDRVPKPAWAATLDRTNEQEDVFIECILTDGSRVTGFVKSFNEDYEESQDRDIRIEVPSYYPPNGGGPILWTDEYEQMVIISASSILLIHTTYVPFDEIATAPSSAPAIPPAPSAAKLLGWLSRTRPSA